MISVLFYPGSDQEHTIIGKVVYAKKKNKRNLEFDLYVYNLLSAEQKKVVEMKAGIKGNFLQ